MHVTISRRVLYQSAVIARGELQRIQTHHYQHMPVHPYEKRHGGDEQQTSAASAPESVLANVSSLAAGTPPLNFV